jgi:hypothetical protein
MNRVISKTDIINVSLVVMRMGDLAGFERSYFQQYSLNTRIDKQGKADKPAKTVNQLKT